MPREIERKFLVDETALESSDVLLQSPAYEISQGYLLDIRHRTLRIRKSSDSYVLTYKGKSSSGGLSRTEIECNVPKLLGKLLLSACPRLLRKSRYLVFDTDRSITWELDRFHNVPGLKWLAEIEIPDESYVITKLHWLGEEVTGNVDYYNSNLIGKAE